MIYSGMSLKICMANRINIYLQLLISTVAIVDINSCKYMLIPFAIYMKNTATIIIHTWKSVHREVSVNYYDVLNVCRDLFVNGNDLQCQGVIDLVHILVQQAVKDDADRQEEERIEAIEAIQAARLGLFVSSASYDMIRYDTVYLRALNSWWTDRLNLVHDTKNEKRKNWKQKQSSSE